MAGPLMHTVTIAGDANEIYEAISTGKGLASFWTRDSKAEPKVGSTAKFGFSGPVLELKVAELKPGKLVRWTDAGGFPSRQRTWIPDSSRCSLLMRTIVFMRIQELIF